MIPATWKTGLAAGRGGKLVSSQTAIKTTTDFDLVTWMVIKNEQ